MAGAPVAPVTAPSSPQRPLLVLVALLVVGATIGGGIVVQGMTTVVPSRPQFPFKMASASAVWDPVGKLGYLFGGELDDGSVNNSVLRFNPDDYTNNLKNVRDSAGFDVELPSHQCGSLQARGARTDTSAAWVGNRAYIFGGRGQECPAPCPNNQGKDTRIYLDQVVRFDPHADGPNMSKVVTRLPTARADTVAATNGREVFIFGGQTRHWNTTLEPEAFDCPNGYDIRRGSTTDEILRFLSPEAGGAQNGTIAQYGRLPYPLKEMSGAYFKTDNSFYLFGGTAQAAIHESLATAHTGVLVWSAGGGTVGCIYYHRELALRVRIGDIRLTPCQGFPAGTAVDSMSTAELAAAPAALAYHSQPGLYTAQGALYLMQPRGANLAASTGPAAWTLRLTQAGAFAAGTFVATGNADAGVAAAAMPAGSGFMLVDRDLSGTLTLADKLYVGTPPVAWSNGLMVPTGSVRLIGFDAHFQDIKGDDTKGSVRVLANEPVVAVRLRKGCSGTPIDMDPGPDNTWSVTTNLATPGDVEFTAFSASGALDSSPGFTWPQPGPTVPPCTAPAAPPYGNRVLSTDPDSADRALVDPATAVRPSAAVILQWKREDNVANNCFYAHLRPGSRLAAGDVRLTACDGKAAGTMVTTADAVELAAANVYLNTTGAQLVYRDAPTPAANVNLLDSGDQLYLTNRDLGAGLALPASLNPDQWTLRLTPSGTLGNYAAGTLVLAAQADVGAAVKVVHGGGGLQLFDTDYDGKSSQGDALYAGNPVERLFLPVARGSVRLAGPYGAFGSFVVRDQGDAVASNFGAPSSAIIKYAPGTRPQVLATKLPGPRNDTAAVSDGGRFIYIFGGQDPAGNALAEVLRFEPATGILQRLYPDLPQARREMPALHIGGCSGFYIFGGHSRGSRVPWDASPSPTAIVPPPPPGVPPPTNVGRPIGVFYAGVLATVVRVSDCPPDIVDPGNQLVLVGEESNVCFDTRDSDDNSMQVNVEPMPVGARLTIDPACLVWTPREEDYCRSYTVKATVYDGEHVKEMQFIYDVACYRDRAAAQDIDLDGVEDWADNCPGIPNHSQSDADGDGRGDPCEGVVSGGRPTNSYGPGVPPPGDRDFDTIADEGDNCPTKPNPAQQDLDRDRKGDACDPDMDGDGINDKPESAADTEAILDNCPYIPNQDQKDSDFDGTGDACFGTTGAPLGGGNSGDPTVSQAPVGTDEPQASSMNKVLGVLSIAAFVVVVAVLLALFLRRGKGA